MPRLQVLLPLLAAIAAPAIAGPTKVIRTNTDVTVVELVEPPLITEVVPYFTQTVTSIKKAGDYTLGLDCLLNLGFGCVGQVIHALGPTVCTITGVKTKTTTYPCTTATTFTKPTWDLGCGCTKTKTFWWTPHPSCPSSPATTVTVSVPVSISVPPITVTVPVTTTAITTETTSTTDTSSITDTATVTETTSVTQTTTSTTTASCEPTLTCDRFGYLSQTTHLYRVDLETGETTTITDSLAGETNAIGYNILDNFIYGRQNAGNGTYNLVRISGSGGSSAILNLGATVAGNVGDIDSDGYYWMASGGQGWWRIDLRPGSATYGTVVESGTADALGYGIADWVYIPSAGRWLYAVATNSPGANTSTLLRFSMDTHTWSVVRQYTGTPSSTWGAQYGINTGILYASDNTGGQIWSFPIDGSAPTHVTDGPPSGQNDGARCVLNIL